VRRRSWSLFVGTTIALLGMMMYHSAGGHGGKAEERQQEQQQQLQAEATEVESYGGKE
jgi:hypothetical protein